MNSSETPVAGVGVNGVAVFLRSAAPADLPALEELVRRAVLETAARDYPHQLLDEALGGPLAVEMELISDGTYYVAMAGEGEDARIAGAGGWSRRASVHAWVELSGEVASEPESESPPAPAVREMHGGQVSSEPENGSATIRAFYVDPQYARRGVGALLLSRCLAEVSAAGYRRAELVATLTGEKLYERAGFRAVARLNAMLPNGGAFPVVRMVRELR